MNNFDFKKYFGNLVGMPTSMKQPIAKPKLQKGVSDPKIGKKSS